MKIIIVGCGKFGVRAAEDLTRKNHDVTIVDTDRESFHALSEEFTRRTICGMGYDKDVLIEAGVATADVLISCTNSDAINAVTVIVAKNVFHVPTVVARMYDPIRARMFESMGVYTVSITRLGVENVMDFLEDNRSIRVIRKMANDDVELIRIRVNAALDGTELSSLIVDGKMQPVSIERGGHSMMPEAGMRCEYNDVLYLTVSRSYMAQARAQLQL